MSPFIIVIVILIILLTILSKSKSFNSNANWGAGFSYLFLISTIIILIISEFMMRIFADDLSSGNKLILSSISIPIIIIILWKTFNWIYTIKNYTYLPEGFNKEYLIIIYEQEQGQKIEPDWGFPRKRKLVFNHDGMLKIQNRRDNIFSPSNVVIKDDGKRYTQKENTRISTQNYKLDKHQCSLIILNYDQTTQVDVIKAQINTELLRNYVEL